MAWAVVLFLMCSLAGLEGFGQEAERERTVGDLVALRRRFDQSASDKIASSFPRDLSNYERDQTQLSVSIDPAVDPAQLVLDPGQLAAGNASLPAGAEDVTAVQLVRRTDHPLAIVITSRSGVLLTKLQASLAPPTVSLASVAALTAPAANVSSVSEGFAWRGRVFYSHVVTDNSQPRVHVDAFDLETLEPVNIMYWVEVTSEKPLMFFFDVADHVYFLLEDKLYLYQENYLDRLDHEMLDTRYATCVTGFNVGALYYIVVGMAEGVESPVYVFEPRTSTLHLTQRLATQQVTDLDHFYDRHTSRHFVLLLQDKNPAKIYLFANEQLTEWQEFHPGFYGQASSSFSVVGEKSIFAVSNVSDILVYVEEAMGHFHLNLTYRTQCKSTQRYSGISGYLPYGYEGSESPLVNGVFLKKDLSLENRYLLGYQCVSGDKSEVKFVILRASLTAQESSDIVSDELVEGMNALQRLIDSQQPLIDDLAEMLVLDTIMTTDVDQVWTGPIKFESSIQVEGTLSVENLNLNISSNETEIHSIETLEEQIGALQSKVSQLEVISESNLYKTGDQVVSASIHLNSVSADAATFEVEPRIQQFNDRPLIDFDTNFLRASLNQTISTPLVMEEMRAVNVELNPRGGIAGSINGLKSSDFLISSRPNQVVTGKHVFKNAFLLANVEPTQGSQSVVLLNSVPSTDFIDKESENVLFSGTKVFLKEFQVDELNVTFVNGIHFDTWHKSLVHTDSLETQTMSGKVIIDGSLLIGEELSARKVNNYNLTSLDKNIARKSVQPVVIETPVVFDNDVIVEDVFNVSSVNSVRWTEVIDFSSKQTILAKMTVTDAGVIGNIYSDNINGVDFSNDVAVSSQNQTIDGRVRFSQDVTVDSPTGITMGVKSRINKVDPSELGALLGNTGQVVVRKPFRYLDHLNLSCALTVNTLNGINVDSLPTQYWRKSIDQKIPGNVSVGELLVQGSIITKTFNNLPVHLYFLNGVDQLIGGSYNFQGGVHAENDLTFKDDPVIDGINLRELEAMLVSLDTDQIISGTQNFAGGLKVKTLTLTDGLVNNVSLNDLVRLDRANVITGLTNFTGIVTSENVLSLTNVTVGVLNGYNLASEVNGMVKINEDAIIHDDLIVSGPCEVKSLVARGRVDSVDIEDLDVKTLKKVSSAPQRITGRVIVNDSLELDGPTTCRLLNNEVFTAATSNAITRDFSGTIKGKKTFINTAYVIDRSQLERFNGYDVDKALDSILTKSGNQTITGDYFFFDLESLSVTAPSINQLASDDIVLVDQTSKSIKTAHFTNHVIVTTMHAPTNTIGGCDLKLLESFRNWKKFNSRTVSDPLTIGKLRVTGDVVSHSKDLRLIVGNTTLDFIPYMDSFVSRSRAQQISGQFEILGRTFIHSLNTSRINKFDVDYIQQSVLRKSSQQIDCHVEFENALLVNNLEVSGNISSGAPASVEVSGVEFDTLVRKAVRKSKLNTTRITGLKTYVSGLDVMGDLEFGRMNGISKRNFLNVPSLVDADVVFNESIFITGNLTVHGKVDGVDVDAILRDRIDLQNSTAPSTSLSFDKLLVQGHLLTPKINDVIIDDLVLSPSSDTQTITGRVVFEGNLFIDGDIITTGAVNGYDVVSLNKSVIRRDRDETLDSGVVFAGEVEAPRGRVLGGQVASLDFDAIHSNISALDRSVQRTLDAVLRCESGVRGDNLRYRAVVADLRSYYKDVSSASTFSTCKRISRISVLQVAGYNPRILVGFPGNCSAAHATPCKCRGTILKVTSDGDMKMESCSTSMVEVLPRPHGGVVLINSSCEGTSAATRASYIGENSPSPHNFSLPPGVVGVKVIGDVLVAAVESAGEGNVLQVVRGEPGSRPEGLPLNFTVVDICTLEVNNTWHVVVVPEESNTAALRFVLHDTQLVPAERYAITSGGTSCVLLSASGTSDSYLALAQRDRNVPGLDEYGSGVLVFHSPATDGGKTFTPHQRLLLGQVISLAHLSMGTTDHLAVGTSGGLLLLLALTPGEGFREVDAVRLQHRNPQKILFITPLNLYFTESSLAETQSKLHPDLVRVLKVNLTKTEVERRKRDVAHNRINEVDEGKTYRFGRAKDVDASSVGNGPEESQEVSSKKRSLETKSDDQTQEGSGSQEAYETNKSAKKSIENDFDNLNAPPLDVQTLGNAYTTHQNDEKGRTVPGGLLSTNTEFPTRLQKDKELPKDGSGVTPVTGNEFVARRRSIEVSLDKKDEEIPTTTAKLTTLAEAETELSFSSASEIPKRPVSGTDGTSLEVPHFEIIQRSSSSSSNQSSAASEGRVSIFLERHQPATTWSTRSPEQLETKLTSANDSETQTSSSSGLKSPTRPPSINGSSGKSRSRSLGRIGRETVYQNPSYIVVAFDRDIALFEVKTSGVDGDRLLREIRVE